MSRSRKKLVITGCREVHRGQGQKGQYVIYKVLAKDEEGNAIREELRSFKALEPKDEPQDFDVEKYDGGERPSFTLYPVKPLDIDELGRQLNALRVRVERLESGGSPGADMPAGDAPAPDMPTADTPQGY